MFPPTPFPRCIEITLSLVSKLLCLPFQTAEFTSHSCPQQPEHPFKNSSVASHQLRIKMQTPPQSLLTSSVSCLPLSSHLPPCIPHSLHAWSVDLLREVIKHTWLIPTAGSSAWNPLRPWVLHGMHHRLGEKLLWASCLNGHLPWATLSTPGILELLPRL